MRKKKKRLSVKSGLPPGALVPVGLHHVDEIKIEHYQYNQKEVKYTSISSRDLSVLFPLDKSMLHWIQVAGTNVEVVKTLGEKLGIHTLVLEDILNNQLRPKYENLEEGIYLAMRGYREANFDENFESIPVNFIMGGHFVISFLGVETPFFEAIVPRLKNPEGKLRSKGTDYLFFALADIVVDSYFPLLEKGTDLLEEMEENIDLRPGKEIAGQIQDYREILFRIRRSIFPLKEAYTAILKEEAALFKEENQKYFRDTLDHILFSLDQLDYLTEYLNSLRESYQSHLDNELNQTMKVLTLIATLFIPLTFLAGIYGMNFEYIPELSWKYGYFGLLGVMLLLAVLMVWYFRRKKWF